MIVIDNQNGSPFINVKLQVEILFFFVQGLLLLGDHQASCVLLARAFLLHACRAGKARYAVLHSFEDILTLVLVSVDIANSICVSGIAGLRIRKLKEAQVLIVRVVMLAPESELTSTIGARGLVC